MVVFKHTYKTNLSTHDLKMDGTHLDQWRLKDMWMPFEFRYALTVEQIFQILLVADCRMLKTPSNQQWQKDKWAFKIVLPKHEDAAIWMLEGLA